MSRSSSSPLRLVLAPGIEGVVHGGLEADLFMVVLAVRQGEAACDRGQAGRLRGHGDVCGNVGTVNAPGEAVEGGIGESVLHHDRFKAAPTVGMAKFHSGCV